MAGRGAWPESLGWGRRGWGPSRSASRGAEGEAQGGSETTRARRWSLRGDPVLSQLNTWAEIPEADGTPSFPPYWGVMPQSSRFLFLEASIEYFRNEMVPCQAL